MLTLLLRKELKLLLREPSVRIAIILPFIIYAGLGGAFAGVGEQVKQAVELRGYSVAVVGEEGPACSAAALLASLMKLRGVNATHYCGVDPLSLLGRGFNMVLQVKPVDGNLSINLYVSASLSKLMASFAAPSAVAGLVSREGQANVTLKAFIVLDGRVWGFEDLQAVFNTGLWLTYAFLFVAFPAVSISASLIAAEREERMLETMLSLPFSRRSIAVAKAIAALIVGFMVAASAMAGLQVMFGFAGAEGLRGIKYYGAEGLVVYAAAVASTALLMISIAMILGLFTTSYRGAHAISGVVSLPFLAVAFLPLLGMPETPLAALIPYVGIVYAALYPLTGPEAAALGAASNVVYAGLALLAFTKLLESELAVTGPETLKQFFSRFRRR